MTVRLDVEPQPASVAPFEFPCAETECWQSASAQLHLHVGSDDYLLAVCPEHAASARKEIAP